MYAIYLILHSHKKCKAEHSIIDNRNEYYIYPTILIDIRTKKLKKKKKKKKIQNDENWKIQIHNGKNNH